ncbi:MAG: hypothetical protein A2Y15_01920 [Clostridiales bacterium GWF2_36_10]|nr:MAG: hypothetical protein A2Y15_01920 [Clostridiales bacterium GWF2_36_10]
MIRCINFTFIKKRWYKILNLTKKPFLILLLASVFLLSLIVPSLASTLEEPVVLTMLGTQINPEFAALRFGARYNAALLPKGASVVSMGILIIPEKNLVGDLTINLISRLLAAFENKKAEGVVNFNSKRSFSDYSYIDYYVTKSNFTIKNIDTSYAVRAYLMYKLSGKNYYVYSDTITRTYRGVYEANFPNTDIIVGDETVPNNSNSNIESDTISFESSTDENSQAFQDPDYLRGIWVSQYDMNSLYVYNGVQRSQSSYTSMVKTMIANIKKNGFNTIFLHVRPFGDSMYVSEYFPVSLYVRGSKGTSISYDPIQIYVEQANAAGISVHAWINPMRLMLKTEISSVDNKFLIKKWYNEGSDRVVEVDGRLYLNPYYEDVRQLINNGAAEILNKYDVDGIHIDDYFYPTTSASYDSAAFTKSGYTSLSAFRENNINLLVSGLYNTVHQTDYNAVFGVSPAGNLSTIRSTYFIDVAKWCSQNGYIDYILPQLYYGFLHGTCPFDEMVNKWSVLVTNPKIKFYVGMSGGNAFAAYNGDINVWAGTTEGKYEWINHKDVLKRSFEYIFDDDSVDGYCFFCYQFLYSPSTGAATPNLAAEYSNFYPVMAQ